MRETIAEHYPGLKLFISEWNFGNDTKINGALAIADVLGIYGREGVEAAAYWRNPAVGSPGWFAFTMHGNYDGKGGRFGGVAVPATVGDDEQVGAYAALDQETGVLRVMLVNRSRTRRSASGWTSPASPRGRRRPRYVYSPADLDGIVADTTSVGDRR